MALSAWRQLPGEPGPFSRYFRRAMLYAIFVWVPVTGYFYYAYSDWSWAYVLDPGKLPAVVGPMVLTLYVAGQYFGFLAAQHLIREKRTTAAVGSMVATLVFVLAIFALTGDQYVHVGTRAQYLAGKARPINADGAFMLRLNLAGALLVIGAGGVMLRNFLEGRVPAKP